MSEPILPDWAVEVHDADTTAVLDFVGPTMNPVTSLGLMLTQRCSIRTGIILYEPIRIALVPDQPITILDAPGARAVRAVLDALSPKPIRLPMHPPEPVYSFGSGRPPSCEPMPLPSGRVSQRTPHVVRWTRATCKK